MPAPKRMKTFSLNPTIQKLIQDRAKSLGLYQSQYLILAISYLEQALLQQKERK